MAALPVTVDLTAYRGDSWAQTFRFLEAGTPIDLAAATVAAQARKFDGEVVPLVAAKGDPGEVTIGLPPGGLDCGSWTYDVEVTFPDPDPSVTTWVRGTLTVSPDVTNSEAAELVGVA